MNPLTGWTPGLSGGAAGRSFIICRAVATWMGWTFGLPCRASAWHSWTRARGAGLASVRRAWRWTDREERERLIAVCDATGPRDSLLAGSVTGEGIYPHQECAHVFHQDFDQSPSKLEQRTGWLDRSGALAEREGRQMVAFEPYLSGTHDE